jgi:hypothetical protein
MSEFLVVLVVVVALGVGLSQWLGGYDDQEYGDDWFRKQ